MRACAPPQSIGQTLIILEAVRVTCPRSSMPSLDSLEVHVGYGFDTDAGQFADILAWMMTLSRWKSLADIASLYFVVILS